MHILSVCSPIFENSNNSTPSNSQLSFLSTTHIYAPPPFLFLIFHFPSRFIFPVPFLKPKRNLFCSRKNILIHSILYNIPCQKDCAYIYSTEKAGQNNGTLFLFPWCTRFMHFIISLLFFLLIAIHLHAWTHRWTFTLNAPLHSFPPFPTWRNIFTIFRHGFKKSILPSSLFLLFHIRVPIF